MYSRVFGAQSHIEWGDVKRYLADVSHTTEEWLALVNLLDFAEEDALRMRPEVPPTCYVVGRLQLTCGNR